MVGQWWVIYVTWPITQPASSADFGQGDPLGHSDLSMVLPCCIDSLMSLFSIFHTVSAFIIWIRTYCMLPGFQDSLSFGKRLGNVCLFSHSLRSKDVWICGYAWRPSNSSSQGNPDKGRQKALSAEQFLAAA